MISKSNKSQITFVLLGQEHGRCPNSVLGFVVLQGCLRTAVQLRASGGFLLVLPKVVHLMLTSTL